MEDLKSRDIPFTVEELSIIISAFRLMQGQEVTPAPNLFLPFQGFYPNYTANEPTNQRSSETTSERS